MEIIIGLLVDILLCAAVARYAERKGLSAGGYFLLSLFLTPILGMIFALASETRKDVIANRGGFKKCPDCAELIQADARKCRFCAREFWPEGSGPSSPSSAAGAEIRTGAPRTPLVTVILSIVILVLVGSIVLPNIMPSKMAENERQAIHAILTINVACVTYASTYGVGFPSSLGVLGPGKNQDRFSADLLDLELAGGEKAGYKFIYRPGKKTRQGFLEYQIIAEPKIHDKTGIRKFFSDQTGVIRFAVGAGEPSSASTPIS